MSTGSPGAAPTLSVVIPAKDDAMALDRCLRLMSRQTRAPFEVVVVDNASVDDTPDVARRWGARVVVEKHPGIPAAASTGYDAARGSVVVRCDADTVPPPDWLERIERQFAADPDLEALTGSGYFYGVSRPRSALLGRLYLRAYYVTMHAALAHPPLWGSNMALRRSTWDRVADRVHRHDPEVHDDVDLALAFDPLVRIRHDRTLRVGVSGRSLRGVRQTCRRFRRAFRTLRLGWSRTPPWDRWRVVVSARGARPSSRTAAARRPGQG